MDKKKKTRLISISVFIVLFIVIIAVDTVFFSDDLYEGHFYAMDTTINISGKGTDMDLATRDILKEINEITKYMSANDVTSKLYALNNSKDQSIEFNKQTLEVLSVAEKVRESSGGAFNIAVKPLVDAWGFGGKYNKVPSKAEIADALRIMANTKIVTSGNTVSLPGGGALDLGGIAKGYASDRSVQYLKKYNVEYAVLDYGGNILTYGVKPDKSKFVVGIKSDADNIFAKIKVGACCVITSGDYERYFIENGKKYHHILDPATGYPADSGLTSVTIISDKGVLADALSTACFVLGREKGMELAKSYGVSAVFLGTDKKVYTVGDVDITIIADGYKLIK
ncbi:MAG: FAD:protein FMN transferase [Bacillota bacterium]|nr:FAD:protein FMN transferase [Bacillota bacterium]